MNFQEIGAQIAAGLQAELPRLGGALLILAVGWWASNQAARLMYRAMKRSRADTGIITFLCSLARAAFKIIVCIIAAEQLGMNINSIIAALGAAGLTVGLALKDSMSNIASGAQIIFTKPFKVGDYLALADTEGTVERIETMFTTLRTFDNKTVIIPNSKITVSVITNYSAMQTRRLDLKYIVGYDENLSKVRELLSGLAQENPLVLQEPAPVIAVGEHTENGVAMGMQLWCKTEDYWTLYSDMQEKVKLAFENAGMESPFRRLDVRMKTSG
ncbi:MAG TPA: mechanosensitive ion channel family protein [Caproiciproducens sp.]|nr:mechanosensitive ion channel family protein [Caproiciproducens sp.]